MARPQKANVSYFPHDTEHRKTLFILEAQWGNDGYAVWFKVLEQLGAMDYHYIDCRNKITVMYLAAYCKVSENLLTEILDMLAELDAIDKELWSKKIVFSQNFINRIADAYSRRKGVLSSRETVLELSGLVDSSAFGNGETEAKQAATATGTSAPSVPGETKDDPPAVPGGDPPVPDLSSAVPGDDTPEKHGDRIPYQRIINALNEKLRTKYRVTDDTRRLIKARWRDGFREDDFLKVVEVMQAKWGHDPKMSQYLRPVTLFGTKMDGYLNQKVTLSDQGIISENLEKNLGVFERFAASIKEKREAGDAERGGIQPGHGDVVRGF